MKHTHFSLLFALFALFGFNACTPALPATPNPTIAQHQISIQEEEQNIKSVATHIETSLKEKAYLSASPEKMKRYENKMKSIASGIPSDPEYQRIPLDTEEKKEWFKDLTFRLWDRQITRQQFLIEGLKRYPAHLHEFQFIIDGFEN